MSTTAVPRTPVGPVAIGAIVGNLRPEAEGGEPTTVGLGTISFFALVNGIRERRVVLVTSRHVLAANGGSVGTEVFAPHVSVEGSRLGVQSKGAKPIARVSHEGLEGHHGFAYPGEPPDEYFVDAAAAELLPDTPLDPRPWLADGSAAPRVRGIGRLHPLDASGTRRPRVRRIVGVGGAAAGRVVTATATVVDGEGRTLRNLIAIRVDDDGSAGPGTSGALVVDARGLAVGMVWGRDQDDPGLAYACHIHPVLDRLDVTPLLGGLA